MSIALSSCAEKIDVVEHTTPIVNARKVEVILPTAGEDRYSAVIAPASQMEVLFKGAGYVDQIQKARDSDGNSRLIHEGDLVKQGSVLARLRQNDNEEKIVEQQASLREVELSAPKVRAAIESAEAELKQAKIENERLTRLFNMDSLTKPELDTSNTRVAVAQARVEDARAQIPVSNATQDRLKASIREARFSLKDGTLIAPMTGIILKRNIEEGSLANNGMSAFTLADVSKVKAVFGLPDVKLPEVKLAMPIKITSEAIPDRVFTGKVTEIGAAADPKTRVFSVEVTIPNNDYQLKVGMVASLELGAKTEGGPQLAVPFSAVIRSTKDAKGYSVYTLRSDGGKTIAEEREVKLGEPQGTMITVLAGLNNDERVVTNGNSRITSGQEVRVLE